MDPISDIAYPQTQAWLDPDDYERGPEHNEFNLPVNVRFVAQPPDVVANSFDFETLVGKTITDFGLRYKSSQEKDGHLMVLHLDDHSTVYITTGEPESAEQKGHWPRLRVDPSLDSKLRSIRGDNFGTIRKTSRTTGLRIGAIITRGYRTSKTSNFVKAHRAEPALALEKVHNVLGMRLSDPNGSPDVSETAKWLAWVSCDRRTYSEKEKRSIEKIEFFDINLSFDPGPQAEDQEWGLDHPAEKDIEMRCEHCLERMSREKAVRDAEAEFKAEYERRWTAGRNEAIEYRETLIRLEKLDQEKKKAQLEQGLASSSRHRQGNESDSEDEYGDKGAGRRRQTRHQKQQAPKLSTRRSARQLAKQSKS